MNKMIQDLRHGRIPGWDKQVYSAETDEEREKIRSERQYFASIMSEKDFERFRQLETLHAEGHARRYANTYASAFKLGVMLMCAVFTDGDDS